MNKYQLKRGKSFDYFICEPTEALLITGYLKPTTEKYFIPKINAFHESIQVNGFTGT